MKTPDKQAGSTGITSRPPRDLGHSIRPQGYQEGNKPLNPLEVWWYKNFSNNIKPDWNN